MNLMEVSNEIQVTLGRSYNIHDDIDEEDLMGGKQEIFTAWTWVPHQRYVIMIWSL